MAGTKAGAEKRKATLIAKLGGQEAYDAHMKQMASKGGKNGGRGGFAMDRELARTAGHKGQKVRREREQERAQQDEQQGR